jgi:hypothetical protein
MPKRFTAEDLLPATPSADGKHVTIRFMRASVVALEVTMPSPVAARLIESLHEADALARDRYLGVPERAGELVRKTVRQPRTLHAQPDAIGAHLLLTLDEGRSTELTIQIPLAQVQETADRMLEISKSAGHPMGPKPN